MSSLSSWLSSLSLWYNDGSLTSSSSSSSSIISNLVYNVLWLSLVVFLLVIMIVVILLVVFRWKMNIRRKEQQQQQRKQRIIGFFHPHCSSGGGGERVLWAIVKALHDIHKQGLRIQLIIYTIDPPQKSYKADLLKHVKQRFSIKLSSSLDLSFVHLHEYRHLLEPAKRFSMLVESWRTMKLAYIALSLSASSSYSFSSERQLRQEQEQQPPPPQQQQQQPQQPQPQQPQQQQPQPQQQQPQQQPQPQQSIPPLPRIFFDTTGYAFTYPIACLLFGCQIVSYVHYPTISTDMLSLVWERRRSTYNHQEYITSSRFTTYIKLLYYSLFALAYGMVGSLCTLVMVNSSWTYNHIHSLWWMAAFRNRIRIIYPPCRMMVVHNDHQDQDHPNNNNNDSTMSTNHNNNTTETTTTTTTTTETHLTTTTTITETPSSPSSSISPPPSPTNIITATRGNNPTTTNTNNTYRERVVLSIGQFRPEKDHQLQIESFALLLEQHPTLKREGIQLILIGSCRDGSDQQRLEYLKQYATNHGVSSSVQFIVNQPYTVVQDWLRKASVGIHTMWNEHFGIGIVEMMSAGLIVIAHNSGGPQSDIILRPNKKRTTTTTTTMTNNNNNNNNNNNHNNNNPYDHYYCDYDQDTTTGFLATTKEEYAMAMYTAFSMNTNDTIQIRRNAQLSATRFTDEVFSTSIKRAILECGLLR